MLFKQLIAILLAGFTSMSVALAQDCPRGDLDARFCDADGDLVADTPTDESELVDPDPIVFAYTPVEDPAVYEEAWSDFISHLALETGKSIQFFPVQSNAAQLEAMRSGRLHVSDLILDLILWR